MLKRTLLLPLAALGALMLATTSGASAGSSSAVEALESPTGAWFVQLSGSVDSFQAKAKAAKLDYTERFRFNRAWKGLSLKASAEAAQAMRGLDGVTAVYPVLTASIPPTANVSEPELMHAVAMTGADVAQNELGLSGEGVKVAVMDTGIDYHNPALGGCFGAGCRVVTGHDFVGDRFNAGGSGGALIPHPDNDPDDCNGHGSHVAGIVGADGTVNGVELKGVAPEVTFGAYRVFGCDGSTSVDIMVAAMELALADDMDVLNMSIGNPFAWPNYPTAVAANALVDAGVVVVASIGNSGGNGLFSTGAPGNGSKVIGVASFDNSHVELRTFTAEPDDQAFGYTQAAAAPEAPRSGTMPLTRTGTPTTPNDGCAPLAEGSLAGNVALIRRGTCTFHVKALNAQNAGAIGVVLYNNVSGLFSPTVAGPVPITIPVVAVSDADGANLSGRIPTAFTETVDISWTDQTGVFPNPTGGLASSFTSYGLTPDLDLKPDIGAPGGLIKSTYPLEAGGIATISGTSMSSPHVAGAAALFLEARPGTSPAMLRSILQNSADPVAWSGNPGLGFREFVHRQGAGMVDIDDAILSTTTVTPGKLVLGEGTGGSRSVTIVNNGASDVTYSLSHLAALSTNLNTFAPGAFTTAATVTFSQSGAAVTSVLVPAGGSATVDANISISPAATLADRRVYGGYLVFTGGGWTFRVPYAGFRGDYQSIQVIGAGACTFPGVFKSGGATTCAAGPPAAELPGWTRQSHGATYNVEDSTDRPVLLYHLTHQSERLEIRAVNEGGEEFLAAFTDNAERNPTNDLIPPGQATGPGFFVYTWDGKAIFTNPNNGVVNRRALDPGTYKLKIMVQKARQTGDTSGPYVETWESAPLNIIRSG